MAQTLLGNVKGPKGDTGAQGPQGEQGPTGAQGPQGETGPANTAFITDAFSTSQAYNAGDYCIYNNTLYRFTENKTAGEWDDSKVTSTLIGTELSGLNSRGTWVPKLYDVDTYVRDLPAQEYYKVGDVYFLFFLFDDLDISGVNTMVEFRNAPCTWILGGSCYFAALQGLGETTVIQASDIGIYFRPNISISKASNGVLSGRSAGLLIGV